MANDEKCTRHPDRRGVRWTSSAEARKVWYCDECSAELNAKKEKESGGQAR